MDFSFPYSRSKSKSRISKRNVIEKSEKEGQYRISPTTNQRSHRIHSQKLKKTKEDLNLLFAELQTY